MPTEREKKFVAHWKTKRKMGKWKFCLVQGVLLWAIPVFVILQLVHVVFKDDHVFEVGQLVTSFVVWVIMGFFGFGLLMWWLNERAYRKLTIKNPNA